MFFEVISVLLVVKFHDEAKKRSCVVFGFWGHKTDPTHSVLALPGVSVHVSNAAPKSETRGGGGGGTSGPGYGPGGPRGGPGAHGSVRGQGGPDGSGGGGGGPVYQQRYAPGPNQGSWGNQGPRGNIDMPNLQALGGCLSLV